MKKILFFVLFCICSSCSDTEQSITETDSLYLVGQVKKVGVDNNFIIYEFTTHDSIELFSYKKIFSLITRELNYDLSEITMSEEGVNKFFKEKYSNNREFFKNEYITLTSTKDGRYMYLNFRNYESGYDLDKNIRNNNLLKNISKMINAKVFLVIPKCNQKTSKLCWFFLLL
jgi:hypothetical protein